MKICLTVPVRMLPVVAIVWLSIRLAAGGTGQTSSADTVTDRPAHAGIGVFGNALGVHGTMQVTGDVVLKYAEIVGEGTLILKDTQTRQLLAEASTVGRLVIDNPAGVALQGNLTVQKQLIIRRGTFDVRQAHLHVADSSQVIVLDGAQLRQTVWLAGGKAPRPARNGASGYDGWLARAEVCPDPGRPVRSELPGKVMSQAEQPEPLITLHYPPPEIAYIDYRSY